MMWKEWLKSIGCAIHPGVAPIPFYIKRWFGYTYRDTAPTFVGAIKEYINQCPGDPDVLNDLSIVLRSMSPVKSDLWEFIHDQEIPAVLRARTIAMTQMPWKDTDLDKIIRNRAMPDVIRKEALRQYVGRSVASIGIVTDPSESVEMRVEALHHLNGGSCERFESIFLDDSVPEQVRIEAIYQLTYIALRVFREECTPLLVCMIRDPHLSPGIKVAALTVVKESQGFFQEIILDPDQPEELRKIAVLRIGPENPLREAVLLDPGIPEAIKLEVLKGPTSTLQGIKRDIILDRSQSEALRVQAIHGALEMDEIMVNILFDTSQPASVRSAAGWCCFREGSSREEYCASSLMALIDDPQQPEELRIVVRQMYEMTAYLNNEYLDMDNKVSRNYQILNDSAYPESLRIYSIFATGSPLKPNAVSTLRLSALRNENLPHDVRMIALIKYMYTGSFTCPLRYSVYNRYSEWRSSGNGRTV